MRKMQDINYNSNSWTSDSYGSTLRKIIPTEPPKPAKYEVYVPPEDKPVREGADDFRVHGRVHNGIRTWPSGKKEKVW